jgi:uncharacterized protein YqgV (UPF0045/DUF77 family)
VYVYSVHSVHTVVDGKHSSVTVAHKTAHVCGIQCAYNSGATDIKHHVVIDKKVSVVASA